MHYQSPLNGRNAKLLTLLSAAAFVIGSQLRADVPEPVTLGAGWQMQDSAKVSQQGGEISQASFKPASWYPAIVPGTVLTTLVADGVYPEPLYGENNRPDKIPESLCRTPYWYRTQFQVPSSYSGRTIWLNFAGINYSAEVWVNGKDMGSIKGAFIRGTFDISSAVSVGQSATLAVEVFPQPNPGIPHEHTLARGIGGNGGVTAIDGPTFLCSIGWDWIPAIRDRNTGIWQKVLLCATGPVTLNNPLVTTDLPLPKLDSADIGIEATLQNVSDAPVSGVLNGSFGDVSFQQPVQLDAHSSKLVSLDSKSIPALHVINPKLWWPNGYGAQYLYKLHLTFDANGVTSDVKDVNFGIRKFSYSVPGSENLTISVNGVPIFCKGGDWGMDEAMKRVSRERLEAELRMHQFANYTIIRNWVGQSTSDDFYDLCDKYGILLWDEFFQPNPSDGPNPKDEDTYIANVRDKILRFRNHPSIAVWCARNEGFAPPEIDAALRKVLTELEPTRLYQPSSTSGRGVHSSGPYLWRKPQAFYTFNEAFKTEIGSMSVPTLESIHGMMPQKDWEQINDDWAEHDMAGGASGGEGYRSEIEKRYGPIKNLADFVRKSQLANFEAFRAMYEGRNAKLFSPCTGVITWMSNPAQPSFVWQLYHHDLEPNSSLFAVKEACEPVHIQLNEKLWTVEVINNFPTLFTGGKARLWIYNLDGSVAYQHDQDVTAATSSATDLGAVAWPANLSSVHFVKFELRDRDNHLVSNNFYWRALPEHADNLADLEQLPKVTLKAQISRHDSDGKCLMDVTLTNPATTVALMAHLQLRRQHTDERVLPVFYSDNYVSLIPGETKTITIEAAQSDMAGASPLVVVDGWNIDVTPVSSPDGEVELNTDAQVDHWPITGLPIYYGPSKDHYKVSCGGTGVGDFEADNYQKGGSIFADKDTIDTSAPLSGPAEIYQTQRWGDFSYIFVMNKLPAGQSYTVRLHFAESSCSSPGGRVFNVAINGKPVLKNLDVFQEAGGKDKALVKVVTGIQPSQRGNTITVALQKGSAGRPELNAIEVVPSQ